VELPGEPMPLTIAVGDRDEAWGPQPNLNVLVADASEPLDVQEPATLAVSGIVSAIDEVHVMAYDLWPGPDDLEGRRIAFAYPQGGVCSRRASGCSRTTPAASPSPAVSTS
jgi:hypothetical protein